MSVQDNVGTAKASPRGGSRNTKPLNLAAILGDCLCVPFHIAPRSGLSPNSQFIELHGVEFIGLGAVVDELKPNQRVRETVEQLTSRPERQVTIGYLLDEQLTTESQVHKGGSTSPTNMEIVSEERMRITESIPLDIWQKNYPNDRSMARPLQRTIEHIKTKQYNQAIEDLYKIYETQKAHPGRSNNRYLVGITAHNIAVIYVLANRDDKALPIFRQAAALKRSAFGQHHPQVATSLDEIGIQLFAREHFEEAMSVFHESKKIRVAALGETHPAVAMCSNNIACCDFQLGNTTGALATFEQARDVMKATSQVQADLDLLQVAIVLCNVGYMQIRLKQYEEAQAIFEEALLIQQSVLGDDNHPTIKDTRSNMEFTNAFHS